MKEILCVSEAHESQQKLVQQLQARAKKLTKLEDLCIKQEKVIDYLQKILDKQSVTRKAGMKFFYTQTPFLTTICIYVSRKLD